MILVLIIIAHRRPFIHTNHQDHLSRKNLCHTRFWPVLQMFVHYIIGCTTCCQAER